ncbi:MAG: hypothetical protein NT099_02580 [Candidatus Saganbacteria bacterium]|nr:hypothetical protein [Candidatus Saganbacteria bacterium]
MALPADSNPEKEAQRIVAEYLSGLGWARQWQQVIEREPRSFGRDEREDKLRKAEKMMEETEDRFSQHVEKYLHDSSPEAKQVLENILKKLSPRRDLGFFCQRILSHIKNKLGIY